MDVGIDQRGQRRRRFEDRVERDPDLAEHVEVGPEAGSHNNPINLNLEGPAIQTGSNPQPVTETIDPLSHERRKQLEATCVDGLLGRQTQCAPRRKLVVEAAPEELFEPIPA
jgi:hypothetical protein